MSVRTALHCEVWGENWANQFMRLGLPLIAVFEIGSIAASAFLFHTSGRYFPFELFNAVAAVICLWFMWASRFELTDRWNEAAQNRGASLVPFGAVAILLLLLGIVCNATAGGSEQQICDVRADYSLGVEDYQEAIRLHAEVVRKHPDNAVAHYHLGFAEGMLGDKRAEVREYKDAAALGLRIWDLFLNMGLVQLENGELEAATDSLQQAVALGRNHFESHYNLALTYERRGQLADAEREMLSSLRLDPGERDARNMLGVIYAQEGKTVCAAAVWRQLLREVPDYEPARTNLALLGSQGQVALGETAAIILPPAAAAKAVQDPPKLHSPIGETDLSPASAQ